MNSELVAIEPVVRLFADLLLREVDAPKAQRLHTPPMVAALRELGIEPPPTGKAALEGLAAEYFETFVQPRDGFPLIQSLVEDGRHEGEASRSVRAIAEAAGLVYDRGDARGVPMDHLGSELLLFAALAVRDGDAAREMAQRHVLWALPLLRLPVASQFYSQVRQSLARLIETLLDSTSEEVGR